MYGFTNHFSHSSLRYRVGMINRRRSGSLACMRYAAWAMAVGVMVLACRHKPDYEGTITRLDSRKQSSINASEQLANELEKQGALWFRQSALIDKQQSRIINGRRTTIVPYTPYPEILCLRSDHLALRHPEEHNVNVFVNGQPSASPDKALSALRFEEVDDLLVYQKWDDAPGADKYPESYRVFISTTHKSHPTTPGRVQWTRYLKAAGMSEYPLGKASTFSMNKLLEATFFSNKLTFVKRRKDDYLTLYEEYKNDIDLYINGLSVQPKDIDGVHVREVDKLYAGERSFDDWMDGPNRKSRFVLYIQTAPSRAKRDSSYYVFSPFYSGDF